MNKIVTIVGARPQFVKAAVVSRALAKAGIEEVLVHTGQHYDPNMSALFFEEMEIHLPKYNLEISNLNHGAMTGRMIEELEKVLIFEKPQMVLVYGDTNSTLAGALAASKLNIKVAHVEAGLRSFNRQMPEEINRILTDRISSFLFCPTVTAIENLKNEGFEHFDCQVISCGDVMMDAAFYYAEVAGERSTIIRQLELEGDPFVLATIHRQENTNDAAKLKSIFEALNDINQTMTVVVPVHPRTRKIMGEVGIKTEVKLIDPVGYFDMIQLLKYCKLVMTDSGGVQKESFFFGKFCITLREETEWVELVENGFNLLAGSDHFKILGAFHQLLGKVSDFSVNLYGDGHAAEKIAEILKVKILDVK